MSYPDLYVSNNPKNYYFSSYRINQIDERYIHESKVQELESKLEIAREALLSINNVYNDHQEVHAYIASQEALERIK